MAEEIPTVSAARTTSGMRTVSVTENGQRGENYQRNDSYQRGDSCQRVDAYQKNEYIQSNEESEIPGYGQLDSGMMANGILEVIPEGLDLSAVRIICPVIMMCTCHRRRFADLT